MLTGNPQRSGPWIDVKHEPRGRRRAVLLAAATALTLAVAALPTREALAWSYGTSSDGQGWSVTNGDVEIPMANERVARQTANRLDRAERKAEKRAENNGDGVVDNGDGNCGGGLVNC